MTNGRNTRGEGYFLLPGIKAILHFMKEHPSYVNVVGVCVLPKASDSNDILKEFEQECVLPIEPMDWDNKIKSLKV